MTSLRKERRRRASSCKVGCALSFPQTVRLLKCEVLRSMAAGSSLRSSAASEKRCAFTFRFLRAGRFSERVRPHARNEDIDSREANRSHLPFLLQDSFL